MIFNEHKDLRDKHAFLSPSNYHWLRYDDQHLFEVFENFRAIERGTELHAFAKKAIELGIKLARTKSTLNMYVNDAIGFRMSPEVILKYSDYCFGTADAICFREERYPEEKVRIPTLRIHDLKTGQRPAKMDQLLIYAGIFCLEYKIHISDIRTELRIYQNDQCLIFRPPEEQLKEVCNRIVECSALLEDNYGRMRRVGQ